MRNIHLLSTADLTRVRVEQWIEHAEYLRELPRKEVIQRAQGSVVATLFYEPSTRTRLSFESAASRIGASVISAENARENSSAKKGETLEDVFRIVGSYADVIVLRHHEDDAMHRAAKVSPVPIINAGAGKAEHPTQALLDVYTLWREMGSIDGLKICMMGDLKYGRTAHSLLRLLTLFDGVDVTLLSPPSLQVNIDFMDELRELGLHLTVGADVESVFRKSDVVYQTRIQQERLQSAEEAEGASQYKIGRTEADWLPAQARILHPLPRVDEISADVDDDARAAYFRQAQNGLYLRMAILDDILGGGSR